jgi:hypothetical protein
MIFLLRGRKAGKSWYFRACPDELSTAPEQPATYHDNAPASKHVIRRIVR